MKPKFFITGLPRTRTAWMAHYMSAQGVLCLHEPEVGCASLDELADRLESIPEGSALGVSSSGLAWFQRGLRDRYPDAKWVVIRRLAAEVAKSLAACFPEQNRDAIDQVVLAHEAKVGQLLLEGDPLVVEYPEIDDRMPELARYCVAGWQHNEPRHVQMLRLNIQVRREAQKRDADLSRDIARLREPFEPSPKARRLSQIMGEICDGNPAAARWWNQLLYVADTYDHLVDRDLVDPAMAHAAFEAMVLEWPLNGFLRQYATVLVPMMSAAISAWRADPTGYRAGDVYTESANAICFLLRGQEGVNRWMPEVRRLVREMRDEDMRKDGQ
ncbi:MAG TPA: hypothetical protein VMF06_06910 [Candidatus Limnocylindria bacterium]|nr:hypothetical protein [Candidatus Limnocylindria bacterium]